MDSIYRYFTFQKCIFINIILLSLKTDVANISRLATL